MTKLHGAWFWYELMTPDAAASKAFYDHVVGWNMTAGTAETNGYGFIVNADGGMTGGVMPLTEDMKAHGAVPCWLGYVGVDDCDAAAAAITAVGGSVLMPPTDIPMAGRIAMVTHGSAAPFYIMTPTPQPDGGQSTSFSAMPNLGRCGWNELHSTDAAQAMTFHAEQFGWAAGDGMDMGPLGTYQFIEHDGVTIGAIMPKMLETPAPMWCHYFWVANIPEAAERITANGGHIVNGPMEVPGPLWIVQGIDPQGAFFSLVGEQ